MDFGNLNFLKESPFYSRMIPLHSIFRNEEEWTSKNIQNWIHDLPIIDRDYLSENEISKLVVFSSNEKLNTVWSTGTSGRPLCVFRNSDDESRFWNLLIDKISSEPNHSLRVLFLCTLGNGQQYDRTHNVKGRKIQIHRRNIGHSTLEQIESENPDVITTNPLGIEWMLKNSKMTQEKDLKLIYSTSLPLVENLSQRLALKSQAKYLHTYSTTETGPIAFYCSKKVDCYHVFSDIYVEEIQNKLLVSKLFKSAIPLLRYRTGDSGQIQCGQCACGYIGQTINNLQGRK